MHVADAVTDGGAVGHTVATMVVWALTALCLPLLMVAPPSAFDLLYSENFDFVWRSLRRMGIHDAMLDDGVQEVFVVAHRKLDAFEGRSSARTWLFGIARRVASDFRRGHRRKGPHEPLPDTLHDAGLDPHAEAERREAARLLARCLEAIQPERREVFTLMELEGMTAPEVAEATGAPLNTVYSRLRLARAEFERAVAHLRSPTP